MRAAFIAMSILGCDNSGSDCHPVATLEQRWPTITACDAASEAVLARYSKVKFPLVVAVCQTAETTALSDSEVDLQEQAAEASADRQPGLTVRALSLFKSVIPSRRIIKQTVTAPVHFVTETYSWVAHKIVP